MPQYSNTQYQSMIALSPDVMFGILLGLFLMSVVMGAVKMLTSVSTNDTLGTNKVELYPGGSKSD